MSKPAGDRPWLTYLLVVGILGALGWIFSTWMGRQPAFDAVAQARQSTTNPAPPTPDEAPHEFSGKSDLNTAPQQFAGGTYVAVADFGPGCGNAFLRLYAVGEAGGEKAGQTTGPGQQTTYLYNIAPGEYYIGSNVNVQCEWQVRISPG